MGLLESELGSPWMVQPRQWVILTLYTLSRDRSSPWGLKWGPFGVQASAAPLSKPFTGGSGVKGAISVAREPIAQPTPEGNQQQGPAVARDTEHARAQPKLRPVGDIMLQPPSNPTNDDSELVSSRSTFCPSSRLPLPV